mmetsp:Transcript_35465/g.77634  ORF Transcript_35465/g.77634 Transcript_35465/m.77634 type:complete len:121 (-) Transcript_35465:2206-2568(-)
MRRPSSVHSVESIFAESCPKRRCPLITATLGNTSKDWPHELRGMEPPGTEAPGPSPSKVHRRVVATAAARLRAPPLPCRRLVGSQRLRLDKPQQRLQALTFRQWPPARATSPLASRRNQP